MQASGSKQQTQAEEKNSATNVSPHTATVKSCDVYDYKVSETDGFVLGQMTSNDYDKWVVAERQL